MHRVPCSKGLEHLQIVVSLGISRIPTVAPKDEYVSLDSMGNRAHACSSQLPPSPGLISCDYLV